MSDATSGATIDGLLAAAGLPRSEAVILLAHVLRIGRVVIAAHGERAVPDAEAARFRELAGQRARGEPIAYLVGVREFYGREFAVGPAVLIPRPETELLVDLALGWIDAGARRVLDLGTGSGAIAVSIAAERPAAEVHALDVSEAALAVARANAARHGANVRFLQSDWYAALGPLRFDVIVANPPYVAGDDPHLSTGDLRFEPPGALTPGGDGLDAIRAIVSGASNHLHAGGWLAVEHGFDQGEAVAGLFGSIGYVEVCTHKDLAGHGRVTAGRLAR